MTCFAVGAVGLAVVAGAVVAGPEDGSDDGAVDGVLDVVVPDSPPTGTGRPPSLESLLQALNSSTPTIAKAGRANLRTD
jgi:hypothetical protein